MKAVAKPVLCPRCVDDGIPRGEVHYWVRWSPRPIQDHKGLFARGWDPAAMTRAFPEPDPDAVYDSAEARQRTEATMRIQALRAGSRPAGRGSRLPRLHWHLAPASKRRSILNLLASHNTDDPATAIRREHRLTEDDRQVLLYGTPEQRRKRMRAKRGGGAWDEPPDQQPWSESLAFRCDRHKVPVLGERARGDLVKAAMQAHAAGFDGIDFFGQPVLLVKKSRRAA